MHHQTNSINTSSSVATHFHNPNFVSHELSFHQSAAMYAAKMVRFQYTKESKTKFRRECLDHLKASLAHEERAST
ncbi:hypothetical protein M1M11_31375 [Pseudomonas azerbaijanoccidens]|uniref:hypothetical protein n=1 Tax=Pseudomonas azerbaijanoccidentalis TaxID=2842347 RepID=UPI00200B85AB|nr:hypothetical protein [Pseudomonas azerbaijanoccidentalis]MCK8669387.1 hypothetical protein [Pseudomonas azerbaijanoccidentalis]